MLTHESLTTLVESDPFIDACKKVAYHTGRYGVEAAFAAYQSGTNHKVSKVINARNQPDAVDADCYDMMVDRYTKINVSDLTIHSSGPHKFEDRLDVILLLHSHPSELMGGAPMETEDALIPSTNDLVLHDRINISNPGIVSAIMTLEKPKTIASMLLFRKIDTDQPQTYLRHENDRFSRREIYQSMTESGFSVARLRLDLKRRQYLGTVSSGLVGLYN